MSSFFFLFFLPRMPKQYTKEIYTALQNKERFCWGCETEQANQLGHSCLTTESFEEQLDAQLYMAIDGVLSKDELIKLVYPKIHRRVLRYHKRKTKQAVRRTLRQQTTRTPEPQGNKEKSTEQSTTKEVVVDTAKRPWSLKRENAFYKK